MHSAERFELVWISMNTLRFVCSRILHLHREIIIVVVVILIMVIMVIMVITIILNKTHSVLFARRHRLVMGCWMLTVGDQIR